MLVIKDIELVGLLHWNGEGKVPVDTLLRLERQRCHQHDQNAIVCIDIEGHCRGYIAKDQAVTLAPFVDSCDQEVFMKVVGKRQLRFLEQGPMQLCDIILHVDSEEASKYMSSLKCLNTIII